MRPSDQETKQNEVQSDMSTAAPYTHELTALYTLLVILFLASMAYIIVKAVIHSRKSGFLSTGTKSETFPINGKGVVNAA
ncbi:hypothetical protein OSTOST_00624 [Ostertagia ostertagi]